MKGGYALIFELPAELQLTVGKRHFHLKPGVYVYSGSALSGVKQRVKRHIRILNVNFFVSVKRNTNSGAPRYHWHIDHLLPHAINLSIIEAESDRKTECVLVQHLKMEGMTVIKGFGSTDCTSGCGGHLLVVSAGINLVIGKVLETYKSIGVKNTTVQDPYSFK